MATYRLKKKTQALMEAIKALKPGSYLVNEIVTRFQAEHPELLAFLDKPNAAIAMAMGYLEAEGTVVRLSKPGQSLEWMVNIPQAAPAPLQVAESPMLEEVAPTPTSDSNRLIRMETMVADIATSNARMESMIVALCTNLGIKVA